MLKEEFDVKTKHLNERKMMGAFSFIENSQHDLGNGDRGREKIM